jgi:secreted trypsin-like serine protease
MKIHHLTKDLRHAAILVICSMSSFWMACSSQTSHTLEANLGNEKIVGGVQLDVNDEIAPHIVGLEIGSQVFCTGVLVKKNVVLTAAHCTDVSFDPRLINIIFGKDLTQNIQKRKVLGGVVTEKWPQLSEEMLNDPEQSWGDLAMLKFEGEAPEGFAPARILGNAEKLTQGLDVIIAGYGLTKMPDQETLHLLKTTVQLTNPAVTDSELLFEQFEGRGACHGDSGGPAFAKFNDKLFLIGITSRSATASGGENCLEGSIYTSVAKSIDFLVKAAKHLDSPKFVPGTPIPQPNL